MYNKEPIFLEPVFQERIWGGKKLNTQFGYAIPYEHTGEAWVISAHPNGPSNIINGPLQGKTLIDAWQNHKELFGSTASDEEYPLLVKILDAAKDLSVQVHPNDTYAREVENQPYGKTECWYVIDAEEGAEIIFGHHAQTKEEFQQLVDEGKWNQLLRRVKVKQGEFIYVPSGTIHAIGKGIVILETQQSSDITYRVYDYDRTDASGNTRELHLDSAIAVTSVPHETIHINQEEKRQDGLTSTRLVQEQYFSVYVWNVNGTVTKKTENNFLQLSVIEGSATIVIDQHTYEVRKGDHFLLPATVEQYELNGEAKLIVSHP